MMMVNGDGYWVLVVEVIFRVPDMCAAVKDLYVWFEVSWSV